MRIIWLIIAGLIVGALGRLINPGRDPMVAADLTIGVGSVLVVAPARATTAGCGSSSP